MGLSTNFLVIQYENYVAQARSTEVASRGAYAKARIQLDAVMGTVLQRHNVTVEEALGADFAHVNPNDSSAASLIRIAE